MSRLAFKIGIIFTIFTFLGFGPHFHELLHHFHEVEHQHKVSCLFENSEMSRISHSEHPSQTVSVETCLVLQHLIRAQKNQMKGENFVLEVKLPIENLFIQNFYQSPLFSEPFDENKQSRGPPYFI